MRTSNGQQRGSQNGRDDVAPLALRCGRQREPVRHQPELIKTGWDYFLEMIHRSATLAFGAQVAFASLQTLVLLAPPAGPRDCYPVDLVALSPAKRQRQFRLRQIARSTVHDAHLRTAWMINTHHRADRVAVRLRADQVKANAAAAIREVVAIEIRRPIVGR